MERAAPSPILHHRSFEAVSSRPLAALQLQDRQRLALVLQAAALLSHLERARSFLPHGFDGAGVTSAGLLVVPAPRPGRPVELPQDSLLALIALLFGESEPSGRGEARRIVRALVGRWRLALAPVPPDRAVGEILAAAEFLWLPAASVARQSLVAELEEGGSRSLLLAGPAAFRRALLAEAASRSEMDLLLASERARELWQGAAKGRAPHSSPAEPAAATDRREEARRLSGEGLYEQALALIQPLDGPEVLAVRLDCQVRLGKLGAAAATLRRIERLDLPPAVSIEVAQAAVRLLANQGKWDEVRTWVQRARDGAQGRDALHAHLVAAVAATDLGEGEEARAHLESAREALTEPEFAWRWTMAASLLDRMAGNYGSAQRFLRDTLSARRRLTRMAAAEVWNELGVCRAALGDLAGAERAFLHAVRLFAPSEGPRATTLALSNLGETRLRRGRLPGVRHILEHATAENRLSGNVRGQVQDLELWARFELAHGRLSAALEHCRTALRLLAEHAVSWRRDVLAVLSARALGWMGQASEAARLLADADAAALAELEPEERPALFALAGDRERALLTAEGLPFGELWQSLLLAREPMAGAWAELRLLEPFRAARFIFDADLVAPELVPVVERRRAIAAFRQRGIGSFAERLEARDARPWEAVAAYLAGPPSLERWLASLVGAGLPELGLRLLRGSETVELVAGPRAGVRIEATVPEGVLALTASEETPELHTFFRLAARDLAAMLAAQPATTPAARRRDPPHGLVGSSPLLARALDLLAKLAPSDLPVLILGESGTGKELAARMVHLASARQSKSFVAMNCAAVAESLLLSDLFGHVRGAFTGADRDRAGVFETAQGGTVFLDEIGDLPAAAQGMLLRVLQEGEVRRVGESLPRRVDVRVVAATHRDLARMVTDGGFRQDLYFRLKVAQVTLPPLRERPGDIPLLTDHFFAAEARRGARPKLSAAAAEALLSYPWPGNVRELKSVLSVAAALAAAEGGIIEREHLGLFTEAPEGPVTDYQRTIDAVRRKLIADALAAAGGNRALAARRLGLTRQALAYLLRALKLK